MIDSFWPDATTSIILLPSGAQGESLLALAAEWTKMGLLGPALWVQPERFVAESGAPPHIEAMVLGVGRDQEIATVRIDLFEALAQEALAVVRLVKLRSAVPSRALDAEQDAIAEPSETTCVSDADAESVSEHQRAGYRSQARHAHLRADRVSAAGARGLDVGRIRCRGHRLARGSLESVVR